MEGTRKINGISSFTLHLLAMSFMFCDHLWATVVPGAEYLTCIGRIAFPIFAFMTAEGFYHTRNFKKYLTRLTLFAFLSEIPFNLMYSGSVFYPFHQNVLWTMVLSLLCMKGIEHVKKKGKKWLTLLSILGIGFIGFCAGTLLMTDYFGFGVLTVLLFYVCRGRKWWQIILQIAGLWVLNAVLLGGRILPISFLGLSFEFPQQAFALLSLIPIFLYRGKQGPHNKGIQYAFYLFYPMHMLVLSLLSLYS